MDSIDNIPWLTDETKPIAKEKVKAIDVFVGFPEDYFDVNYVDNLLSAVSLYMTTLLPDKNYCPG